MARLPRLDAPGCAHHVLQRGHNRGLVFLDAEDRVRYLDLLGEALRRHRVALHAYVLLDNHVHLLLRPPAAGTLALCMQALGRAYVRQFNDRHHRSGTLWEGRYRSAPLEEGFVLPCMVWMDTHPVRAVVSAHAADHPWSSAAHYLGRRVDRLITAPAAYWALGNTPFAREAAYADMVQHGVDDATAQRLTRHAQGGWPLGGASFLAGLAQLSARPTVPGRPGRPPKAFTPTDS